MKIYRDKFLAPFYPRQYKLRQTVSPVKIDSKFVVCRRWCAWKLTFNSNNFYQIFSRLVKFLALYKKLHINMIIMIRSLNCLNFLIHPATHIKESFHNTAIFIGIQI